MGDKNSKPYIELYGKIMSIQSNIFISSIQISEFVNRCIRFQFDLFKETHSEIQDFKSDYRNTDDYRNSMDAIIEIVDDMLSQFKRVNDNFENMAIENLLMHSFSYDFNDAFIAELSRNNNAVLVTEDKDYANFLKNITLLTNNRTLLMFKNKR